MRQLLIFLTHNFESCFQKTLQRMQGSSNEDLDIIVLWDNNSYNNPDIVRAKLVENVRIIPTQKALTSYDTMGHALYLSYFKNNQDELRKYKYVWIIENDVYFNGNIIDFINEHNTFEYDLMVPEYGVREYNWHWTQTLGGFTTIHNIGVHAFIMRMSNPFLSTLLVNIDLSITGYVEAILPHICIEYGLSIQCFLPRLCGILTTDRDNPLLKAIKDDISNNTDLYIENKLYHPIKS